MRNNKETLKAPVICALALAGLCLAAACGAEEQQPVDYAVNIPLTVGYNHAGFSVTPKNAPVPYQASQLAADLVSLGLGADKILQWMPSGWLEYVRATGEGDFALDLRMSVFIYISSDKYNAGTWTLNGTLIRLPAQFTLAAGWTPVSIPTTLGIKKASDVIADIRAQGGTADVMMWFDGSSWVSTDVSVPASDQDIVEGRGYFIRCAGASVWEMTNHDITPPSMPIVGPYTTPTSQADIILTGTKDAYSSIVINGIEKYPVSAETEWSVDITISEGENGLSIISKDFAGNASQPVLVNIFLDTIPPSKPVVGVYNNPTSEPAITLSGTKEALSSILIDGIEKVPSDESTVWSLALTLVNGENNFAITSKDHLGNQSEALNIVITLDRIGPDVLTLTANPLRTESLTTISGTVENAPDIKEILLTGPIENAPVSITSAQIVGGSFSREVAMTGTGDITSIAYDNLGNRGTGKVVYVILDKLVTTTINYQYDDRNQVTNMTFGSARVTRMYDEIGNIIKETSE